MYGRQNNTVSFTIINEQVIFFEYQQEDNAKYEVDKQYGKTEDKKYRAGGVVENVMPRYDIGEKYEEEDDAEYGADEKYLYEEKEEYE